MLTINQRILMLHKNESKLGRSEFKLMFALALTHNSISYEVLAAQIGEGRKAKDVEDFTKNLERFGLLTRANGKCLWADTWNIDGLRAFHREDSARHKP